MSLTIIEIEERLTRITDQDYDPESFGLQFVEAMGANPTTLKQLRAGKSNTEIPGAILWRQKAHILAVAPGGVDEALSTLQASKATGDSKKKPRFLIATDGTYISSIDLKRRETSQIAFEDLATSFNFFLPMAGFERFQAAEENPIDIKAVGKLAKLHDAILKRNPDWKDPSREHDLHVLMTRLIFCFFAEDIGILPDSVFSRVMTEMGGRDGETASAALRATFAALARKPYDRPGLPAWTQELPYANGGLFRDEYDIPDFTGLAFRILLDTCRLDWGGINPDIFGSMVQAVINPKERHELGLHYTSVSNIKKAIDPLFMDSLREQVGEALSLVDKGGQIGLTGDLDAIPSIIATTPVGTVTKSINALRAVLARMARIRVLDPAVGSGNFLVVAFREMRRLEIRVRQLIQALEGRSQGEFGFQTCVPLSNFFGIEITDFAAETAKLALFITEQQMSREAIEIFSPNTGSLPLPDGAAITHANALRIDWADACLPPEGDEELYVVGNPPFLGATYQSKEQKEDMKAVFEGHLPSYKSLDFVAAFFFKAARFIEGRNAQAALVSTNSICQGQSVAALWPGLLGDHLEIGFAHRSFRWSNSAKRNAAVTCVIVGLRNRQNAPKFLFQDGLSRTAANINAYLIDADDIIVEKEARSIFGLPEMERGNQPTDGGHLILSHEECDALVEAHPAAERFIRRFKGSQEVIKGIVRYCLWIPDDAVAEAREIPEIAKRIDAVCEMRRQSAKKATNEIAHLGHRFDEIRGNPQSHSILVPRVTSEHREYLPVDLLPPDVIPSDRNQVLYDAPEWCLPIIASKLHRAWIDAVCGKLKTDFNYSSVLGWNSFPVPDFTDDQKARLTACADEILAVRDAHGGKTLAELYDPKQMPEDLRAAHARNDETLERIYIGQRFRDDAERLAHLFELYAARKDERAERRAAERADARPAAEREDAGLAADLEDAHPDAECEGTPPAAGPEDTYPAPPARQTEEQAAEGQAA